MVRPTPRAFPFTEVDSGACGFRPHLQRRDREGFAPSSLDPRRMNGGTLGEQAQSCQVESSGEYAERDIQQGLLHARLMLVMARDAMIASPIQHESWYDVATKE